MTTEPQPPAATAPSTVASIDAPRVPRPPLLSGRAIGLAVFGAAVLVGYAAIAYTEYEPGAPAREAIPASVRTSPGGYRSFHFWHSGYHGGK